MNWKAYYYLMNITIMATFAFAIFGFRRFELSFYIPVIIGGALLTWFFISVGGVSLGKYRWAEMQKEEARKVKESKTKPSPSDAPMTQLEKEQQKKQNETAEKLIQKKREAFIDK